MAICGAGKSIDEALRRFAALTASSGARWVVGGSAALALRGARLASAPRDLDIYADADAVPALHGLLGEHALDGPVWDESGRYRSLLAHYGIGGVQLELVGGFEVKAGGSRYVTEVADLLYPCGDDWTDGAGGEGEGGTGGGGLQQVRLVPLGHELIFNLLRERADRTETVAALIRAEPQRHLPALERLLASPLLSDELKAAARTLAKGGPRATGNPAPKGAEADG